ncbi:MAG: hypothetical protein KIS72_00135 [Luteimonas sp.]|nr:hypothetical protein [Luteimonas sp.]
MTTTRLSKALLVAAIGSIALLGCKKKEDAAPAPAPAPAPIETAPAPAPAATVAVTGVTLGKDEAVTAPVTTFAPGDKTIYAAVATQTSDPAATVPGKLSAKWTHLDSGQTVAEESKDFAFAGPGTTTFNITKPDNWPPGKYQVEISLDGAVVNTVEFEVR